MTLYSAYGNIIKYEKEKQRGRIKKDEKERRRAIINLCGNILKSLKSYDIYKRAMLNV